MSDDAHRARAAEADWAAAGGRNERAVGLQDFVGQAWPHLPSDPSAADGDIGREASLWRFRRATGAAANRPRSPSRRVGRAHMPRRIFLALACGWASAVVILLGAVLVLRWLG
jgi:hypothetical protein